LIAIKSQLLMEALCAAHIPLQPFQHMLELLD
jgi:hypothetical protein